jgi:List-Bact-rpt repeat protein/galactose oxidase-like protein
MRLRCAAHGRPPPALQSLLPAVLAVATVALLLASGLGALQVLPLRAAPAAPASMALAQSRTAVATAAHPSMGCSEPPCPAASSRSTWTNLLGAPQPSARSGAALAYDGADAFTVLFGGYEGYVRPHHDMNDTWILRAGVWQLITPTLSPSPRQQAAFATDPSTGCLLLFGGLNDSSHLALGDTWSFCGTSWTLLNLASSPSPRYDAAAASDPSCSCILLFGGRGSTSGPALGDTWEFASGHWSPVSPSTLPPARFGEAMAWSGVDRAVILFGGTNGTAGTTLGDTWSFSSQDWHALTPALAPSSRMGFGVASLPGTGGVLLTGGVSNGTYYNDTWEYSAGAWSLVPNGTSPPARSGLALTYDGSDNYPILVGGVNSSAAPAVWYGDTWVFGGSLVHFDETGLAPDTIWLVSLNGSTNLTTTSSVGFVVGNGTYLYSVGIVTGSEYGVRYAPARLAGSIHVHGATTRVPVSFGVQYYLRTAVLPASSGFASPLTAWVPAGGALNLVAAPIPGYSFTGWDGQGPGNYSGNADPLNLTVLGPVNETAEFSPFATYTVTFGETGLPAPTSWSVILNGVPYATVAGNLSLTVPNGSYSWSAPGVPGIASGLRFTSAVANGTFTVKGASTQVAVPFELWALVQLSVSPVGGGVVGPSSGWYPAGASILLLEEPTSGYSFAGWQGTGSGSYSGDSQGISVTVNGPFSEVATFQPGATASLWSSSVPIWFAAALVLLAAVTAVLLALLVAGRRPPPPRA